MFTLKKYMDDSHKFYLKCIPILGFGFGTPKTTATGLTLGAATTTASTGLMLGASSGFAAPKTTGTGLTLGGAPLGTASTATGLTLGKLSFQ